LELVARVVVLVAQEQVLVQEQEQELVQEVLLEVWVLLVQRQQ